MLFSCFINIQCFTLIETCKSNRMFCILFAYIARINNSLFVINLTCCNCAIRVPGFSVEFVISIDLTKLLSKSKFERLLYRKKTELYFDVVCMFILIINKIWNKNSFYNFVNLFVKYLVKIFFKILFKFSFFLFVFKWYKIVFLCLITTIRK